MARSAGVVFRKRDWDAAFFDMDGVLTDTARLHIDAWEQLFNEFLSRRAAASAEGFVPFDTAADYLAYVDGRPREDGVRLFLASRGITLPEVSERCREGSETVASLSRRRTACSGTPCKPAPTRSLGQSRCCGVCGVSAS